MDLSNSTTVIVATAIVGIIVVAVIIIFNRMSSLRKGEKKPAELLDPGWQFYTKPTTLDAPGTVFRIDDNGVRYKVGHLAIQTTQGKEAAGKIVKSGQASVGILASLFGLDKIGINAKGRKVERLEFEMTNPVKEETSDTALDKVIDPFLEKLEYRTNNRYFIIRETRMASAMKYFLTEQLINDITGGIPVVEKMKVEGEFTRTKKGEYELNQIFDEPMRVMFLPEEIVTVGVGLAKAKPQLGLARVTEPLTWIES
jgi:hypothetical protein